MSDNWSFPGSKWWKVDFHTHTPKSDDYKPAFMNISEEDWLRSAMQSGLDCVVVSDHNTGGWVDNLHRKNEELRCQKPKPDWYRELIIFPGVEITVADSSSRVHLLAVFDPDCDSQKIAAVLGQCGIDHGFGDDQKTSTTKSFLDTVACVLKAGGIPIPAHIDGNKGLLYEKTTLTPELENSLKAVFAAEFCDLNHFASSEIRLKQRIEKLAKVAGSDAHKPDEIGRHFSWVKMSKPTREGLYLALMDFEYCVKNQVADPNHEPEIYLHELTISNLRHCGRPKPFIVPFHPHFNAIIGGRGTGKSTVVESIRMVSRQDRNLASEAPKVKDELDKFMSQDKGVMRADTEILLQIHRHNENFRLRWVPDGRGATLEKEVAGNWQETASGDILERFPISIYSQKQINELAANPRGLLGIIDRSPSVGRAEWNSRRESVKSKYLLLREQKRDLLRQLAGEQPLRVRLGDIENDLKQYEDKGHGEVLKLYQIRNQQQNALPDDQIFDSFSSKIRELASSMAISDFSSHLFGEQDEITREIKAIHERSVQDIKKVSEAMLLLAERVDATKAHRARDVHASKWQHAVQESITSYNELVREYQEKHSPLSLSLYGEWVQERNNLQQQLKRMASIRFEYESIEKQIQDSMNCLEEMQTELLKKRRHFLASVIGSNKYVRMELVQYGDAGTIEGKFRSLLNISGDAFASSILDPEGRKGILWDICKWEEMKVQESELTKRVSDLKEMTSNIASGVLNNGSKQIIAKPFTTRLQNLYSTQPATFDQLSTWWPEDLLRVKYSKDSSINTFEDLEKGSVGQKAAAILAFLLSYGNEPLIIDQPEDDLDNALISDLIVSQIHDNKSRRQMIIVTHNPNIVVNGDSELVHVLKYEAGQVKMALQGGLEESDIRNEICTIMEGGRQAFDKRYKRITLEGGHV